MGATGRGGRGEHAGDEVVLRPTFNATRAVTIDAQPEAVWPWIVQIGFGRAGWYSYDLLDNIGRHSAERIVPELQHIEVGDLVPLGPGESSGMRVKEFVPNTSILWWDENRADDVGLGVEHDVRREDAPADPCAFSLVLGPPHVGNLVAVGRASGLPDDAKVPARHQAPRRIRRFGRVSSAE